MNTLAVGEDLHVDFEELALRLIAEADASIPPERPDERKVIATAAAKKWAENATLREFEYLAVLMNKPGGYLEDLTSDRIRTHLTGGIDSRLAFWKTLLGDQEELAEDKTFRQRFVWCLWNILSGVRGVLDARMRRLF